MKDKVNKKDDLVAKNCEVIDTYRNKAIIKISEKENIIAKKIGKVEKGDKVHLFKQKSFSNAEEALIYLSPVFYLITAFALGFFLRNDLYHYLLILGITLLGFVQLYLFKMLIKKLPSHSYIVYNNSDKAKDGGEYEIG